MTYNERVELAKAEAKRFLEAVRAYEQAPPCGLYPSVERVTMKRASMDLTRALVGVRGTVL